MKRLGGSRENRGMYMLALVFVLGAVGLAYGLLTLDARTAVTTATAAARVPAAQPVAGHQRAVVAAACRSVLTTSQPEMHDVLLLAQAQADQDKPAFAREIRAINTVVKTQVHAIRVIVAADPAEHLADAQIVAAGGWFRAAVRTVDSDGRIKSPRQDFTRTGISEEVSRALLACHAAT